MKAGKFTLTTIITFMMVACGSSNDKAGDKQPPQLTESKPVSIYTKYKKPLLKFTSTEAGKIHFFGPCTSKTNDAIAGNNEITFEPLADGTYADCALKVSDAAGNFSVALAISKFIVDTEPPQISEISPLPATTALDFQPYSFFSTEAGRLKLLDNCTATTSLVEVGENTITLNPRNDGTCPTCRLSIKDLAGNDSNTIKISYCITKAANTIHFTDVSRDAGIFSRTQTFGAAWGDINNDGFPDLFVSNHYDRPYLFLNDTRGRFINYTKEAYNWPYNADAHGAAWADFDNDGDQDLVLLTGARSGLGVEPSLLLENENGKFIDKAIEMGVDYPQGRGRTPAWLDYNSDGLLDLIMTNGPRSDTHPAALFKNNVTTFEDVSATTGISLLGDTSGYTFGVMGDISGNGHLDFYFGNVGSIFPYAMGAMVDGLFDLQALSGKINTYGYVSDVAIADFDNDLQQDVVLARYKTGSGFQAINANTLQVYLRANNTKSDHGFSVKSSANKLNFSIFFNTPGDRNLVKIGADAKAITNYEVVQEGHLKSYSFSLSRADAKGISTDASRLVPGLYIGYIEEEDAWRIQLDASHKKSMIATLVIRSPAGLSVSDVQNMNLNDSPGHVYLANKNGKFSDQSQKSGLAQFSSAVSLTVGDFDNDMDLDIFMINKGYVNNKPCLLLRNKGNGVFSGYRLFTPSGLADVVISADYDQDGLLDIFMTNGSTRVATYPFYKPGKNLLLRNESVNDHGWLQIDLVGIASNRDGIGAKVYVYAGDTVQVREANGGTHQYAQNFKRLHFGLGKHVKADKIVVDWPSGQLTEMNNVTGRQIMTIHETATGIR